MKVRVQGKDTTRKKTIPTKDNRFPEKETDFEYLSSYGCIEESDANYTTLNHSPWSTQACSFLPDSAAISLGKVEPGDTVRVGYHSMGQEIGANPYTGRWCSTRKRYKRHLQFDGDACMSNPFPGMVRARLVIERPPLKITIPNDNKAWPQIHARAADASYNREQVESTIENVQVRLQDGGTPVAGNEVTIEEKWVDDTGGHMHDGDVCSDVSATEEIELDSNVRRKIKTEKGTVGKGKITAVTDENGEVVIPKYQTPTVSGKWVLEASTTLNGETFSARDTIDVRVPDLVLLPDPHPGDGYTKIGGTDSHHGPQQNSVDDNHFGTQAVVDSLQSLASSWQALVTAVNTLHNRQTPVRINDISLPKGGLFDVCGDWSTPHQFHRVGKDVDIRTVADSSQLEQRRGVLLQTTRRITEEGETELYRENQRFEEVVEEIGGIPEPHSEFTDSEHYHIYFYP